MSQLRRPALLAILVISALLAYLLRDVVYEVVVVPLAYVWWVAGLYYSAIPQWVVWTVLLVLLALVVLWNAIPDFRSSGRKEPVRRWPEGQVEELTRWVVRARHGNYFKWQLANRLGRIARALEEGWARGGGRPPADPTVEKYLDAGLNYSFVDFPSRRSRFERARRTPLDVDPTIVADYLESQMEKNRGRRG